MTATFDISELGSWTDSETFEVTAERIADYAAATNDPIERHRRGEIASPLFAVVPVFPALAPAALAVAPANLLGRLVHGEQDIHFHRPIRPGDELVVRARPTGCASLPNGSTVTVHAQTRTAAGDLVNEQWMTAFFRGADAGVTRGEQAPPHKFDDALRAGTPAASVVAHVDENQTFRYSPASGDPMPIHLDAEIAQLAGLPGIINHGLCTMAFTSWAALGELADGRVERLRRLACRFAKPVLPGQDLTTTFWRRATVPAGITAYAYETTAGDQLVIRDGLAVIGD
ncbi:MAG TPA: MaoC/PaaZ C-terminal domain-containing protein [Pseudonocardiaceae bacterium]|nr:MaoC/PaaZ C-terminal domain-containing protein [Pseudonocardiaceae bacterium]